MLVFQATKQSFIPEPEKVDFKNCLNDELITSRKKIFLLRFHERYLRWELEKSIWPLFKTERCLFFAFVNKMVSWMGSFRFSDSGQSQVHLNCHYSVPLRCQGPIKWINLKIISIKSEYLIPYNYGQRNRNNCLKPCYYV